MSGLPRAKTQAGTDAIGGVAAVVAGKAGRNAARQCGGPPLTALLVVLRQEFGQCLRFAAGRALYGSLRALVNVATVDTVPFDRGQFSEDFAPGYVRNQLPVTGLVELLRSGNLP